MRSPGSSESGIDSRALRLVEVAEVQRRRNGLDQAALDRRIGDRQLVAHRKPALRCRKRLGVPSFRPQDPRLDRGEAGEALRVGTGPDSLARSRGRPGLNRLPRARSEPAPRRAASPSSARWSPAAPLRPQPRLLRPSGQVGTARSARRYGGSIPSVDRHDGVPKQPSDHTGRAPRPGGPGSRARQPGCSRSAARSRTTARRVPARSQPRAEFAPRPGALAPSAQRPCS